MNHRSDTRRRTTALLWTGLVCIAFAAACGPTDPGDTPNAGGDIPDPAANAADPPVRGTLRLPVLLVAYWDTPVDSLPPPSAYADLFSRDSDSSLHSYYAEVSNGLLDLQADVDSAWRPFTSQRRTKAYVQAESITYMVQAAVNAVDSTFDWGRYDNDGPDNEPNTDDDDGFVDALILVHPDLGGECVFVDPTVKDNFRTLRGSLSRYGLTPHPTPSPSLSTSNESNSVLVNDFVFVAGQGGDDGCTAGQPPPIGPLAHELGHVLGLPELYALHRPDPGPGIGRWGLMGMGNLQTPARPLHLSAWAKLQFGWIDTVVLRSDTTVDIRPIESSDTAFVVALGGTTEYLLLSNRQPIGFDSSLGVRSPFGGRLEPGLLIWHVDSLTMQRKGLGADSCWKARGALCRNTETELRNSVNAGTRHGIVFEGQGSLRGPVPSPLNPYDSLIAGYGAPFVPGGDASSFVYPSRVRIELEEAEDAGDGTIRARVSFFEGEGQRESGSRLDPGQVDLPNVVVGQPYPDSRSAATLAAIPASGAPIIWSILEGRLPEGLNLAGDGSISGLTSETGTFTLRAQGASGRDTVVIHLTLTSDTAKGP